MEILKFKDIKNWEQIEFKGRIITKENINNAIKDKLETLEFVHMNNDNYMELETYNIVILPIEETKSKITNLHIEDRDRLENFISNLKARDKQPKHSDMWAQIKEYTNNNLPTFNGEDVTNILEMVERDIPIIYSGMSNEAFIEFLDSLIYQRFTVSDLETIISQFLGFNSGIDLSKGCQWDSTIIFDYLFTSSTEDLHNKNIDLPFIDFDIFVLPTKGVKNDEIIYYITGIYYEIQKY